MMSLYSVRYCIPIKSVILARLIFQLQLVTPLQTCVPMKEMMIWTLKKM